MCGVINNVMKIDESNIKKDFYTTQELVDEKWFPVKSTLTVKKLIESGKLEAVNISTSARFKRYRISKRSVLSFMKTQTNYSSRKRKK